MTNTAKFMIKVLKLKNRKIIFKAAVEYKAAMFI